MYYTTRMNGNLNTPATAPNLLSFSYRYVMVFMISVQALGLLTAYMLGLSLHYDALIKTHCRVSL